LTILPIHAANPGPMTGSGNWTWLIPGRVPTLIDAGTGEPAHLAAVRQQLAGATLAQVLVTHAHTDHASGAPALLSQHPGARFRKMPWPERDAKWPAPYAPLSDADRIEAGETTLVTIHTPGHSPDHLSFWHEESRTLFCGDLAMKGNTVWIPARLQGDLSDYLSSLERVLTLAPARLMPAHGPVIDEPEKVLRAYIDHRRVREEQILEALRLGDTTPAAITARVYKGLREQLLPMAQEGVVAHLVKLEREHRIQRAPSVIERAVSEGRGGNDGAHWTIIRS
jgi:glyoxylase-like metal-dependent hydrolase (beta-lactamase superfamily II)